MLKELKKMSNKNSIKDSEGLSSSHHMAAEASVRRMREFLRLKREEKQQMLFIETDFVR